ncbi:MAG: DUF4982 domain-containing protein [Mediterranea sp.]|jgi:beta-galactosidase/beta-glucuronidase|nr:DUF4982 domain-containing protein [Mediterranea sp.]
MKKRILSLFVLATTLLAPTLRAQVSFGQPTKWDAGWLFSLTDDSTYVRTAYDDSEWAKVLLPHDWSITQPMSPTLAACTGFLPGGIGWYRKHFTIADDAARHYVYFEGVYNRSEVYLNGHLLGRRPNGYISFMYDLTPYLQPGDNVLAVRVDHSRSADSRWYTGSGIYRDVWMVAAPETHIAQWGVGWQATSITDRQATVGVEVKVVKNKPDARRLELAATLLDADGKTVARQRVRVADSPTGDTSGKLTLKIAKPQLWDLDTPYLYTLHTELLADGQRIDGCDDTPVGLRTLHFDPDRGFALNGRWTKVKGVCLHHDAGVLGAAVPREVWGRRLRNLKAIGVNAIRMSHNPQSPDVYDWCDRLGLLVMDEASDEWEFPKRKWIKGWNKGEPGFQGTFDFFEEWIDRDVADMVRRDRNHPSIFLWSIGNEVDYPNDPYSHPVLNGSSISQPMFGGYNPEAPDAMRIGVIAKRLAAVVRSVDTSRPVTGALAGVVMSNETAYPEAVDVVGYNYTEDRYDTDHAKYPKRVIYGSENRPDIDAWYAARDRDFIFGQFIWTGTDYLGESNGWPARGFYTGLLDFGSFEKPRGHFRASLWSEKPVTYIGTYPLRVEGRSLSGFLSTDAWDIWNYQPGQEIRVVCYTNAPQARLLLDGQEVGPMKPYDTKTGIIHWDIPYRPGKLEAQGCDENGNTLSTYVIQTSGRPYALRATADRASLPARRGTAHVVIEVVDEAGVPVKLADSDITCRVDGPARLLGLEGSDNDDTGDYTDNRQRAYHGRLLAYIQTTGEAGTVKVTFASPLLRGTEVTLKAVEE